MRTALVRTGKFRPDDARGLARGPGDRLSSVAQLPDWLEEHL